MRTEIAKLVRPAEDKQVGVVAAHAGLAYDVWAPIDCAGQDPKVRDKRRHPWLAAVSGIATPDGYAKAFNRWRESLHDAYTRTAEVTLASRLLIGHGNPSPTDVGLTLHHTWGVPVIAGTALKGLLAHYMDAAYGESEEWCGVTYGGNGDGPPVAPPGKDYRELFGAPDTQTGPARDAGREALQGAVIFHDALWNPNNCDRLPLAPDVLTVHQRDYYNSKGGSWPNDYDSPNPVSFLTVEPGAKFLVAVSCLDPAWAEFAITELLKALEEWGVGGKTAAGYGRIQPGARPDCPRAVPTPETAMVLGLIEDPGQTPQARLQALEGRLREIASWAPDQRQLIAAGLAAIPENRRTRERLAGLRQVLEAGELPPPTPLETFGFGLDALPSDDHGLERLNELCDRWTALPAEERQTAVAVIREHFATCDPELLETALLDLS